MKTRTLLPLLPTLLSDFCAILQVDWSIPLDLKKEAESVLQKLPPDAELPAAARRSELVSLINQKFRVNAEPISDFLAAAAERKQPLHYHDKQAIQTCFDTGDKESLRNLLSRNDYNLTLLNFFHPIPADDTLQMLRKQLISEPQLKESILRSLFGGYLFKSFPETLIHAAFNNDCRIKHYPKYFDHLRAYYSSLLHRDCALIFINLDAKLCTQTSPARLRDQICQFIAKAYERLGNHCCFAVRIEPFNEGNESGQWKLFSDIILYAEKFHQSELKTGYFNPAKVKQLTQAHIPELNPTAASFNLADEGFFFKDCFILQRSKQVNRGRTTRDPYDLLLTFDRNERDERVIPCPACRSLDVRGNSYPVLGVKSWECQNMLCPERSAFDRGNRYSLASLIKQEAIQLPENRIPEQSVTNWKLDLTTITGLPQIADMLIRHFSLHGDTALFVNLPNIPDIIAGRKIILENFPREIDNKGSFNRFKNSAFFHRYVIPRSPGAGKPVRTLETGVDEMQLLQGDCVDALRLLNAESIHGAVTSPPYYNARSYTQWPNIYCYLYDMYNMAAEVFRVLKPGAIYLFNLFDYFDNENNIVFSAMGKKRMILGAYVIDLFRRIGFEIEGNTIWFKGQIEGKRAFNQGNFSPYYQLPLNCWEHIFVFKKPGDIGSTYSFPTILGNSPVRKLFNGHNLHGHTAPFPEAIPNLLLSQMRPGETVLDPYSGSMTTGRAALKLSIGSVSIELLEEYCDLSLAMIRSDQSQPRLLEEPDSDYNGKGHRENPLKKRRIRGRLIPKPITGEIS